MRSPKLVQFILPALFAALGLLVIVGLPSIAANDNSPNEQCIKCHAQMVLRDSTKTNIHLPFFERQCTVCHVTNNRQVLNSGVPEAPSFASGTPAPSGFSWSNQRILESTAGKTKDHLLALSGLALNQHYRFRIHLAEPDQNNFNQNSLNQNNLDQSTTSVWYNLSPADLPDLAASAEHKPLRIEDFPTQFNQQVLALTLNRSAKDIYLGWSNMELPTLGWVELEQFNGDADTLATASDGSGTTTQHPPMTTATELTIDVCNSCHSDAIGTSHPVRIYSSTNTTKIPEDLPTVDNGMITCVTCHDPHAGMGKQLVREKIATKLCVACHYQFLNKSRSTTF